MLRGTGLRALPLSLALAFLAASLTPSLMPRGAVLQGVLGGIVMGVGYALGVVMLAAWAYLGLPHAGARRLAILRLSVLAPAAVLLLWCLASVARWQSSVREAVGMTPVDTTHGWTILGLAVLLFATLLGVGRAVLWAFDAIRRRLFPIMPVRVANVAGAVLVAFLVLVITRDGVVGFLLRSADEAFAEAAAFFDADVPPPPGVLASGSTASLVDWEAMGVEGRDFVMRGPDRDGIAAFTGRPAMAPIRVYVGREQAETPQERAAVALAELIRVGGFDRATMVIAMPTGTGWLDPGATAPLEYLLGGDIATVSVQYSYLNSPLALIFETESGPEQSVALMRAVTGYWRDLDPDTRPRLFLHGLSLGAWSSMQAVDLFEMVNDPIDGALWAGPPFPSRLWQNATARRDPGSPYVLPVVGDGRLVRFVDQREAISSEGWGAMRVVFLQYASDPIVFYEPGAAFRKPEWMKEPPGQGVSPLVRWIPVVTMLQLALDMAIATSVPDGHGHNYIAEDYITAWVAVLGIEDWEPSDLHRLRDHCRLGRGEGCGIDTRP
nr:alpha/beta-hydrolase family protein [Limimaricola litoreus]